MVGDELWSNRFDDALGTWGRATRLAGKPTVVNQFDLSVAPSGVAVVTWSEYERLYSDNEPSPIDHQTVWARVYDPASKTWSAPSLLGGDPQVRSYSFQATDPKVAVDSTGRALVVWSWKRPAAKVEQLKASWYTPGEGWSTESILITLANNIIGLGPVAIDGHDNAFVIFGGAEKGTSSVTLYALRFDRRAGAWAAPQVLDDGPGSGVWGMTTDNNGNANVVWSKDGTLMSSRYLDASGWAAAQPLDSAGFTLFPRVAGSNSGEGWALWLRSSVTGAGRELWSNHLTEAGWGPAERLPSRGSPVSPSVIFDNAGLATATWVEGDVTMSSQYVSGQWTPPVAVETSKHVWSPELMTTASNRVIAVWLTTDGRFWASHLP
jgi:hypothetical protein